MALFADGPAISVTDLQKCENSILAVASIEGIDLAAKIELAQADIGNQLLLFLKRRLQHCDPVDVPRGIHNPSGAGNVVVTEPLRQWHTHKALVLVYRDAYNNQLNDRYRGKWTEYEELAKTSARTYFRIGVGVVANPIAKAATPLLSAAAGSGSAGTFYGAVAWINDAGQEGASSDVAEITTVDGEQVVVAAVNPPPNATGWNAYLGGSPGTISLQNVAPLAINSTWTMVLGLQPGVSPGLGQVPTWFFVDNHVIQRG